MGKMTNSRYIRCVKPNASKVPSIMQHISTIEQLRCAGVVAAVTLPRSAFPNRMDNKTVRFKFSTMWDRSAYPSKGTDDMAEDVKLKHDCQALLESALKSRETKDKDGKVSKVSVTGKTRSYFRMGALEFLEGKRSEAMGGQSIMIQRYIRGWMVRMGGKETENKRRKAVLKVQQWYAETKRTIVELEMGKEARKAAAAKKERERIAREKAEKKAAAAREARMATEKAEREAREKAERQAEEERERKQREANAKREKKQKEAMAKFDKDKDKKIKKYTKGIKEKEKDLDKKEKMYEKQLNDAEDEAQENEADRDAVLEQIAAEEAKIASIPLLSDKEKKKLEDSSQIVSYLRKENKKLRASTAQLRKDFDTMQENNKRLLEANAYAGASFEALNEQSKKNNSNNSKLMQNLDKYKKQNTKMKEDLRMRQGYYDAEAQIRVNYQKAMAEIMEMIQDQCDDAQLTEDILVLALECESEAKSELAAAEGY